MYKVCLYVFSPKCVLQSPYVCLEFLRNDTGFPLTRSDLWSIEASLFPSLSLSFSDLSQLLVHSLPLLVTLVQGGSVCGTEEAAPRKGAALHTDSIQLHCALLSLPGRDARDARDARALEALKLTSLQNVHQTSCELNANGSATIIYILLFKNLRL